MSSFRDPDHQERLTNAAAARKAMLEKFRAASDDPAAAERQAARAAVNEARLARGTAADRHAKKGLKKRVRGIRPIERQAEKALEQDPDDAEAMVAYRSDPEINTPGARP